MKLYKFGQFLFISLLFAVLVFGQDVLDNPETSNDQNTKETIKVDEFGRVGECDLSNHLQNIRDGELGADPTAKLYIIVYNGKNVLPSEYGIKRFENFIRRQFAFLGMEESRTVFIDGGFREELFAELFIVPKDGAIPKSSNTVSKPKKPKNQTFLFDKSNYDRTYDSMESREFVFDSIIAIEDAERLKEEEEYAREHPEVKVENENDEPPPGYGELSTSPEIPKVEEPAEKEELEFDKFYWINSGFGEILKGEKTTKGVLIFYADDLYYDLKKIRIAMESGKTHIGKEARISADRVEIIFGGYRHQIEIDFWVVPNKAKQPKPTPDERPVETPDEETIH
jgi:hypothetical protein